MHAQRNKSKIILNVVLGVLIAINALTFYLFRGEAAANLSQVSCQGSYSFINPRFQCEQKNSIDKKEYNALQSQLSEFIDEQKAQKKADRVSIWFRDLESGPTFGINQSEDFVPASLLKLPLAVTVLQLSENEPGILQKTIPYATTTAKVSHQTFAPANPVRVGATYTIDELLNHAIVDSDNGAAQVLYEYLSSSYPDDPLSKTYRDLGIIEPGTDLNKVAVNAKEYSSIFRLLYNTSLLNRDNSEKLLSFLSRADFSGGLRSGVPANVRVAHKFGERSSPDGTKLLHDCGIVYYPGNPYLLCVMTRGSDFGELEGIIGEISKQVYEEFDSRNLNN